jgi:hypothetical protein
MRKLDLHGIKHHEVELLVENFVLLYQNECPIEIITGNSVIMRKLVQKVLDKYAFRYSYKTFFNLGSLIIWGINE